MANLRYLAQAGLISSGTSRFRMLSIGLVKRKTTREATTKARRNVVINRIIIILHLRVLLLTIRAAWLYGRRPLILWPLPGITSTLKQLSKPFSAAKAAILLQFHSLTPLIPVAGMSLTSQLMEQIGQLLWN